MIRRKEVRNSTRTTVFNTSITAFALMLLMAATASAQGETASRQKTAKDIGVSNSSSDAVTAVASTDSLPSGSRPALAAPVKRTESDDSAGSPLPANGDP